MSVFDEIWDLLENIASEEQLRLTAVGSAKFAGFAGAGAFTGAILAGPVGGLIGSIVGGSAGCATITTFKPLPQVLREMDPASKQRIVQNIQNIMTQRNITTVVTLASVAIQGSELRNQIIQAMRNAN